jgi:periplasmic copper chaperone A
MPWTDPRRRASHPTARALALLLALALTACGPAGGPDLEVGPAQAAAPVAGSSQIVLEIVNEGDGDDRLIAAETEAALAVEIHQTHLEQGHASMAHLDGVPIPAGERVRFRPGEMHLMMVVPDERLAVGGTFDLTLRFETSGELTVPVRVVDLLDLAENPGAHADPDA